MSNPAGDVAKALSDALPGLNYQKLVSEARRTFGIVLVGDETAATQLLEFLRVPGKIPADVKAAVWRHEPGKSGPVTLAQTELAIVIPATDEHLRQAREAFGGVRQLPIILENQEIPKELSDPVKLLALDAQHVRKVLVPVLVQKLWERRLALGRALPATRDRISGALIKAAVRDARALLGFVAGAGGGRSGAPTPATVGLLAHQVLLIVNIAMVYGADLDDRRALFARVGPHLAPSLLLDQAESQISKLAAGLGGKDDKKVKLYGALAAVVARPTLSVSSTLIAGLVARRVFREAPAEASRLANMRARSKDLGKRAITGVGQGASLALGAFTSKTRQSEADPAATAETPDGVPVAEAAEASLEESANVARQEVEGEAG